MSPGVTPCNPVASPYGKYVIDVSKTDFAPRIGIAWDPFNKGKTSLRMGYGIYHEQVLNGTFLQNIGLNPPYQQTASATNTVLNNPGGTLGLRASAFVQFSPIGTLHICSTGHLTGSSS